MKKFLAAFAAIVLLAGLATAADKPKVCPETGKACDCGCAEHLPCKCAARKWIGDADGTCRLGLWKGETFLGQYQPDTGKYRPWDGTKYLAAIQLTEPRAPVSYSRQCHGTYCSVIAMYSTAPPPMPPE